MNALCIREEKSRDYYHVFLYGLTLNEAGGREESVYGDDTPILRVSCQGNNFPSRGDTRTLYAWRVSFDDVIRTVSQAAHVLRVLTRVEKGMDKAARASGTPADFAEYCGRVARTLGIARFCTHDNPGAWGAPARYRTMTAGEGVDHIRSLDRGWQAESLRAAA